MKTGELMVGFSGSKNMPLFPDLFLRDSHFGNSVLKTARKIGRSPASTSSTRPASSWSSAQFGKIIRIDTKSIRAAGRSTQGVKLLDLEPHDKVAARCHPPKKPKPNPNRERPFAIVESKSIA